MKNQLNVTELDFDQIKSNIKEYFRSADSTFKDWDYEGSGLNQLIEILAYNTHYNAVLAHMSINESFLDSAQIRSNVVSAAKLLGYTPGSYSSPKAYINLSFPAKVGSGYDTFLRLPRGTKLKTTLDNVTYVFFTTKTLVANLVDGKFVFENVEISEGTLKALRFPVNGANPNQKFIINDAGVDTKDLEVNLFENAGTTETESYTRFTEFAGDVTGDSAIYFMSENYAGKYEVTFGDNIFGKRPTNLNVVQLQYTVTSGPSANGAAIFGWVGPDSPLVNVIGSPTISTLVSAGGGSKAETLESIKHNAPLSLIAQNRAVTAEDYMAIIKKEYNGIDAISVWGGETNIENPQFGKVFISIKPAGEAETLKDLEKQQILSFLTGKKVLSITPEIVDPDYTYLFFDVYFKYNSNRTTLKPGALEESVRNSIIEFNSDFLQRFDGVFRFSSFLSAITSSNIAVLNALARVYVYKKINLKSINPPSQVLNFGMEIAGAIDSETPLLSSNSWINKAGQVCYLSDAKINSSVATVARRLFAYTITKDNVTVIVHPDLGKFYPATGRLELLPISTNTDTEIQVRVVPASDDISPKLNQLLKIDAGKTSIFSDVDSIAVGGKSFGSVAYQTFNRQ